MGLRVTERSEDAAWPRGVEETAHHSLVRHRAGGAPAVRAVGFRVAADADLDRAAAWTAPPTGVHPPCAPTICRSTCRT